MEPVFGVEGSGDVMFDDCGVDESAVSLPSTKRVSDPVLYKLVRVEGNGKLVPATDEEVMKVVNFLKVDESELQIVTDSGQKNAGCVRGDESSTVESLADTAELSHCEITEADLKESSALFEGTALPIQSRPNDIVIDHVEEFKNSIRQPIQSRVSSTSAATSLVPNFSRLTGEISLDNLSIRDLHETFKATFGRETTVKDKLWLKRRIAMGLTNSYNIPSTTFTIKDGKLLENRMNEVCVHGSRVGGVEDHEMVSNMSLVEFDVENNCASENPEREPQTSKRVRKPTKRYIEELSKIESRVNGRRLLTTSKIYRPGQRSTSLNKHTESVLSNRTAIRSLDYLGRSNSHTPCVSSARRSRPRKNVNALVKFNPTGMSIATYQGRNLHITSSSQARKQENITTNQIKNLQTTSTSQADNESGHKISLENLTSAKTPQMCVAKPVENNFSPALYSTELEENVESKKNLNTRFAACEDSKVIVHTTKGGIRRKHHRPWTLSEVLKLVEGVSKYGAGRWSEIKRLAFASYSYRTSVDLKDKWRNLLKASFAQSSPTGVINRKHASISIPAAVLSRVRELAEMHDQIPPKAECKEGGCHQLE